MRAVGSTPQDPELTNFALAFPDFFVAGERKQTGIKWVGSVGPLQAGESYSRIIDFSNRPNPPIEPGKAHEVYITIGKHQSAPITLFVQAPLAKLWDDNEATLAVRKSHQVLLKGKVTGPDGQPGENYKVTLWRQPGLSFSELSNAKGEYKFVNIPLGEYSLTCAPKPDAQKIRLPETFYLRLTHLTCPLAHFRLTASNYRRNI